MSKHFAVYEVLGPEYQEVHRGMPGRDASEPSRQPDLPNLRPGAQPVLVLERLCMRVLPGEHAELEFVHAEVRGPVPGHDPRLGPARLHALQRRLSGQAHAVLGPARGEVRHGVPPQAVQEADLRPADMPALRGGEPEHAAVGRLHVQELRGRRPKEACVGLCSAKVRFMPAEKQQRAVLGREQVHVCLPGDARQRQRLSDVQVDSSRNGSPILESNNEYVRGDMPERN